MKKTKIIISVIAALLVIILPFTAVPIIAYSLPTVFDNTFVGALDDKVDRLASIEEEKIIIVGGSSVAFGVDSELIEKYTGMPVVNFGLYAALGTKLMLDLSEPYVNEGDVVVIAPELDAQTLSLYFNSATTARALDGSPELLTRVKLSNLFSVLSSSWGLAKEKIEYLNKGDKPNPEGVYNAKSFDEYGDISYVREENTMKLFYDPNTPIRLLPETFDAEFVDYLNKYIRKCERRGATVLFSFCPMNELAVTEDSDPAAFEEFIRENIDATLISSLGDYIRPAGYFYDSNFHANDAGVKAHTVALTRDLLLELGIPVAVTEDVPEPPELKEFDIIDIKGDDPNAEMFTFTALPNGAYEISGVKEEYKGEKVLTLPRSYDGYKALTLGEGALSGCAVEKLIIPEDTYLTSLKNGCFAGTSSLREIVIYFSTYSTEESIMPPANFFGTHPDLVVYVPEGSNYRDDYYWRERGLTFATIEE